LNLAASIKAALAHARETQRLQKMARFQREMVNFEHEVEQRQRVKGEYLELAMHVATVIDKLCPDLGEKLLKSAAAYESGDISDQSVLEAIDDTLFEFDQLLDKALKRGIRRQDPALPPGAALAKALTNNQGRRRESAPPPPRLDITKLGKTVEIEE